MFTRAEAIKRLERIEKDIGELRKAFQQDWSGISSQSMTHAFLSKCGGWRDARSPEEIVADIYASRTISDRGARLFGEQSR